MLKRDARGVESLMSIGRVQHWRGSSSNQSAAAIHQSRASPPKRLARDSRLFQPPLKLV